jgi:hypothetical protein
MRAVTIGADGGLSDPLYHGLPMNAGLELFRDIAARGASRRPAAGKRSVIQ